MGHIEALRLVEWIFFVGQSLAGLEFLALYGKSWGLSSRSWRLIEVEAQVLPSFAKGFLGWILQGRIRFFTFVIFRQIFLTLMLALPLLRSQQGGHDLVGDSFLFSIPSWLPILLFMITQQILLLYFRGNFNGGSDFMCFVVATGILIARLSDNSELRFVHAGLWYIALYSVTSYFVAGWVKLKSRDWLTGKALVGFMNSSILQELAGVGLLKKGALARMASLGFLALECAFPMVWIGPSFAYVMLCLVFAFHVMNFLIFGLNRFVWIWAATYPAILYTSIHGL